MINTGHRHKHITTHGLSHIQLSSHRQPPLSATLLQTSHYFPFLPIYTLQILGTCPKNGVNKYPGVNPGVVIVGDHPLSSATGAGVGWVG